MIIINLYACFGGIEEANFRKNIPYQGRKSLAYIRRARLVCAGGANFFLAIIFQNYPPKIIISTDLVDLKAKLIEILLFRVKNTLFSYFLGTQ